MSEADFALQQEPNGFAAPRPASILRTELLVCIALILVTTAVYAGVWRSAFINFDDTVYITDNPHLRAGLSPGTLKWILLSFQPDNWFPVTRLSHYLDYSLFGDQAAYHHAVNLMIHICASLALFGFLRRAISGHWTNRIAAFGAFLFALHPLHVESVAWVSERKDVLCAFFWFSALWAWVEWTKRSAVARDASRSHVQRFYFLALGLFTLGLMSKPMIVTFPILLLLLDLWPLRRVSGWQGLISEKLPFFCLSVCAVYLTWLAQRSSGAVRSLETYSIALRFENALITPWIYIFKTIWPRSLSVIYSWPAEFPWWQVVAAGAGLAAVSFLTLASLRRRPWLAVGWFWFLVTLTPVIGLIQVGEQVRADRYMYVPMVGLSLMIAGDAICFLDSGKLGRRVLTALACVVLAVFSAVTWRQVRYWRDSETLFRHAIDQDSRNYSAWFYLGLSLANIPGQLPDAIDAFQHAAGVKPDFVEAREKLARTLCAEGRDVEGLLEFDETLRARPRYAMANFDMGNALVRLGRITEAIPHFREAVHDNPRYIEAWINLGVSLGSIQDSAPDRINEAANALREAVRLDPSNVLAQCDLGEYLSRFPGLLPEAVRHFRAALAVEPENAVAQYDLGRALIMKPETTVEGVAHLKDAQRLAPDPNRQEELNRLKDGQANGSPGVRNDD